MGLRKLLDKIGHQCEPGGKFQAFGALYEAIDTFFYRPDLVTHTTAHVRDSMDLKRMMTMVWLTTFPIMAFGMWNIGYQSYNFV